jgi:hypothetical protein
MWRLKRSSPTETGPEGFGTWESAAFFGLAAACMRTSAGGMAGGDEAGRSVGGTFAKHIDACGKRRNLSSKAIKSARASPMSCPNGFYFARRLLLCRLECSQSLAGLRISDGGCSDRM